MPKQTAAEAYAQFQSNGGVYGGGYNNPGNFTSDEEWANFKEMVPKEAKKAFRAKVAGNENRAIEGMMQGKTREEMGIFDQKENGQALYRRLGAGLGTGIDINKAYDWGGGTATEVGTSDLNKRGIEQRGITGVEQQRHADLMRAGSPEALWSSYRQNQIGGLLNSGAIAQDADGYYNPGPGGGDRYGANLEGYNLGRGVMGNGTNLGGPVGVGRSDGYTGGGGGGNYPTGGAGGFNGAGTTYTQPSYTPGSYTTPTYTPPPATAPQTPSTISAPSAGPTLPTYTPPKNGNTGFTGGMLTPDFSAGQGKPSGDLNNLLSNKQGGTGGGAIYAADGYSNPVMPPGPLPDGGTPLVVHPGENVNVTPANQNPANGHAGPQFGMNLGPQGTNNASNSTGTVREIGPGGTALPGSSPFGSNPVPLPTGNGLVPGSTTSGGGRRKQRPKSSGLESPGQCEPTGPDPDG